MMSRILFVAPRLPEFDRESGSRRLYHLIQRFVQADWFVTLVVENQTKGARYVHRLQQQGVLVYGGTQYRNLPDLLQTVEYDVIFFMFWYVAERFLDPARTLSPDSCLVVDTVDLHLLRQARTYVQQQRPLDAAYASEMRRELNVYIQSDVVVTVSEKESHWINNMLGIPGRALTVPDSESIIPSSVPLQARQGILFIGNFRHPPNEEAIRYWLEDIAPRLPQAIKDTHRQQVVGNEMPLSLASYRSQNPSLHLVGWVPKVIPYLEQSRVLIAPLLSGAGTKRKIIQSLMIGTPVVTTSIGAEGLNLIHNDHALIADTSADFARAVTRLLTSDDLWQRLARQGREHIQQQHGSTNQQAIFDSFLRQLERP